MYNRYIPQPDGTYRRNRMQDMTKPPEPPKTPPPPIPTKEPEASPCNSCIHHNPPRRPMPQRDPRPNVHTGVGGFLKQLLPKDFDTEDLLVVLLLILMAGDNPENQNNALLTLALYLFL